MGLGACARAMVYSSKWLFSHTKQEIYTTNNTNINDLSVVKWLSGGELGLSAAVALAAGSCEGRG